MRTEKTPYVRGPCLAFSDPHVDTVGVIMARQMAKTQGIFFNVIGSRLDDDPAPMVYFGPTQEQIDNTIEPKLQAMLEDTPTLADKLGKGHLCKKHLKRVSGVDFRLGWSSSKSQLKADSALYAFVDELDGSEAEIKGGEGSLLDMAAAIISSYPDGKLGVTSTPTEGLLELETDERTGIVHWKVSETIASPIWSVWQEGSRHEWAVPCPHCREYFMPRFRLLDWPESVTRDTDGEIVSQLKPPEHVAIVEKAAALMCGVEGCGTLIDSEWRFWMNDRGVYIAPGQRPEKYEDGAVEAYLTDFTEDTDDVFAVDFGTYKLTADSPRSATFWVSGLCTFSAKKSYGWQASKWMRAVYSGKPERIKGFINTEVGELYAERGDAPKWQEVMNCSGGYAKGTVPDEVTLLTCGIDIQKRHVVYTVRGWATGLTSWLVEHGELHGETDQPEVWEQVAHLIGREWDELPISKVVIDSGYRAKRQKNTRAMASVYEFCRKHAPLAVPSKGHDHSISKPYYPSLIDITYNGKTYKNGLQLWHFDSDMMRNWVHGRVDWPENETGQWFVPSDIDEDYCKQVVGEARITTAAGLVKWIPQYKSHDYLDAEALAYLAVRILGGNIPLNRPSKRQEEPRKRVRRSTRSTFLNG